MASAVKAVGSLLGMSSGNVSIKTASPVNQDDTIAQADDTLRKRSRQGVNASLSNGTSGDSSISSSSSGQKTLLGG